MSILSAIKGYTQSDAINSYSKTNNRIASGIDQEAQKSWVGARQGLGIGFFCFAGEGQVNGMPPAQYDEFNQEVPRTLDLFA